MSNALMIIGLIGLAVSLIAPVFRVLKKKSRHSRSWVVVTFLSFLIFILGVVLGSK